MKKISIIIPIYNTREKLSKCLESICSQTYKNLEIVCVDDGSDDGSEIIIDEFAKKDARVHVIHKGNGGESSARNVGLKKCTGDYIGFMDCDDWIESHMYEDLLKILENNDVDMVATGYFVDTDNESKKVKNIGNVNNNVFDRHQLMEYVYHRDMYRAITGYIWCKLYKKEILQREKNDWILFDEDLKIGGDILYFAEVALNTNKAIYLDKSYYHYYQRDTSTYHSKNENIWLDILKTYQMVIELFLDNDIENDIIVWVKRFLVYRSQLVAKLAFTNGNKQVLNCAKKLMKKYQAEYIETNKQYLDRINEHYEILSYEL